MTDRGEAWIRTKKNLGWLYLDGDLVSAAFNYHTRRHMHLPIREEYINWYEEMELQYG